MCELQLRISADSIAAGREPAAKVTATLVDTHAQFLFTLPGAVEGDDTPKLRVGRLYLYQAVGLGGEARLEEQCRLETEAIFDMKWWAMRARWGSRWLSPLGRRLLPMWAKLDTVSPPHQLPLP